MTDAEVMRTIALARCAWWFPGRPCPEPCTACLRTAAQFLGESAHDRAVPSPEA